GLGTLLSNVFFALERPRLTVAGMQYIDTYELTRLGGTVQGRNPIAQLTRLLEGLPQQADTQVDWSVSGETDAQGRRFLRVLVDAVPVLECQRCMQPLEWRVRADTRL